MLRSSLFLTIAITLVALSSAQFGSLSGEYLDLGTCNETECCCPQAGSYWNISEGTGSGFAFTRPINITIVLAKTANCGGNSTYFFTGTYNLFSGTATGVNNVTGQNFTLSYVSPNVSLSEMNLAGTTCLMNATCEEGACATPVGYPPFTIPPAYAPVTPPVAPPVGSPSSTPVAAPSGSPVSAPSTPHGRPPSAPPVSSPPTNTPVSSPPTGSPSVPSAPVAPVPSSAPSAPTSAPSAPTSTPSVPTSSPTPVAGPAPSSDASALHITPLAITLLAIFSAILM